MKYYNVYSFINPYEYPTVSQSFKTKAAAIRHFYLRRDSEVFDKVVLCVEDTDKKTRVTLFTYNKPQEVTQ